MQIVINMNQNCKFGMGCLNPKCPFQHNVQKLDIPCIHYSRGACFKGNHCPYLHAGPKFAAPFQQYVKPQSSNLKPKESVEVPSLNEAMSGGNASSEGNENKTGDTKEDVNIPQLVSKEIVQEEHKETGKEIHKETPKENAKVEEPRSPLMQAKSHPKIQPKPEISKQVEKPSETPAQLISEPKAPPPLSLNLPSEKAPQAVKKTKSKKKQKEAKIAKTVELPDTTANKPTIKVKSLDEILREKREKEQRKKEQLEKDTQMKGNNPTLSTPTGKDLKPQPVTLQRVSSGEKRKPAESNEDQPVKKPRLQEIQEENVNTEVFEENIPHEETFKGYVESNFDTSVLEKPSQDMQIDTQTVEMASLNNPDAMDIDTQPVVTETISNTEALIPPIVPNSPVHEPIPISEPIPTSQIHLQSHAQPIPQTQAHLQSHPNPQPTPTPQHIPQSQTHPQPTQIPLLPETLPQSIDLPLEPNPTDSKAVEELPKPSSPRSTKRKRSVEDPKPKPLEKPAALPKPVASRSDAKKITLPSTSKKPEGVKILTIEEIKAKKQQQKAQGDHHEKPIKRPKPSPINISPSDWEPYSSLIKSLNLSEIPNESLSPTALEERKEIAQKLSTVEGLEAIILQLESKVLELEQRVAKEKVFQDDRSFGSLSIKEKIDHIYNEMKSISL
jgi:hypothetical protein